MPPKLIEYIDEKQKLEELVSRHFNLATEVRELTRRVYTNRDIYNEYTTVNDRWITVLCALVIGEAIFIALLVMEVLSLR